MKKFKTREEAVKARSDDNWGNCLKIWDVGEGEDLRFWLTSREEWKANFKDLVNADNVTDIN